MKKLFFTLFTCLIAGAGFAQIDCSQMHASIGFSVNGLTVSFTNTSTPSNVPYIWLDGIWDLGDGTVTSTEHPTHTYAAPGNYVIHLQNNWYDTVTQQVYCTDTVFSGVTVTSGPTTYNDISGAILWDSAAVVQAAFKVWLIYFDSASNQLTAVDSLMTGGVFQAPYAFLNVAPGTYRTKAAMQPGTASQPLMPTYHHSSLYWNTAPPIIHTGGITQNQNILMITGTSTAGPGFIGGSVTAGANKGTSSGVPGLLVIVRDASNNPIAMDYTDANGAYSFSNLPVGTYTVYPEEMNYTTTPSTAITITSTVASVTDIDFTQTASEIKPKTTSIAPIASNSFFTVYPNPVTDALMINWKNNSNGEAQVAIMDIAGRTVLSTTVATNKPTDLNLGGLQQGVYFVNVLANGTRHTEKIILQK